MAFTLGSGGRVDGVDATRQYGQERRLLVWRPEHVEHPLDRTPIALVGRRWQRER